MSGLDWLRAWFQGKVGKGSVPTQRRKFSRFAAHQPVTISDNGRVARAALVDVSRGGLRLRTDRALTVGTVVSVRYDGTLSESAANADRMCQFSVAWVSKSRRGYEAGLAVRDGSRRLVWLMALTEMLGGGTSNSTERRRTCRYAARYSATIGAAREEVAGSVMDLSEGGALVQTQASLPLNSPVRLSIVQEGRSTVHCVARAIRRVPGNDGYQLYGLQFDKLDTSSQRQVHGLLKNLVPK